MDYRARIEEAIQTFIEGMGEKNGLRDACEYALLGGGKRLRPALVLMIAEAIGKGRDVMPAALSVEFFHTASLIADDLPCMDNDDVRRGRPSLHKAFGESTAILASYALIAEGYGGIYRATEDGQIALICLETVTRCAGINGATNGQFLDLFSQDPEQMQKIIYQKTVTLFEIAFLFGWLFGGGELDKLPQVKKCAYHLGMAFQLADDLQDGDNTVIVLGEEMAKKMLQEERAKLKKALQELGLYSAFKSLYASVDFLAILA